MRLSRIWKSGCALGCGTLGVAARTARAELCRGLHDPDGLVAAATQRGTLVTVRRARPLRASRRKWTGGLGTLEIAGQEQKLHGFTFTLGYSRRMVAEVALDQKLGTLLRLHETAFQQLGGVPEEIYDRMKTVWLGTDERGEIVWHPVFQDFARYWGFTPRLCRPYRAQTKGKVEAGVKYVRRNFLCGLQGREPGSLSDLNAQLREWIWSVANQRVHGTTHEPVMVRWDVEQFSLQSLAGQPPYPQVDGELRKVARDAYVDWQGSRYSVPWQYAGRTCGCRTFGRSGYPLGARADRDARKSAAETQRVDVRAASSGDPAGGAKSRRQDPDSPAA